MHGQLLKVKCGTCILFSGFFKFREIKGSSTKGGSKKMVAITATLKQL